MPHDTLTPAEQAVWSRAKREGWTVRRSSWDGTWITVPPAGLYEDKGGSRTRLAAIRKILDGLDAGYPSAIRQARKAAGLTLDELAGILHVDRQTIHRWERGDTEPTGLYREAVGRWLEEAAGGGTRKSIGRPQ